MAQGEQIRQARRPMAVLVLLTLCAPLIACTASDASDASDATEAGEAVSAIPPPPIPEVPQYPPAAQAWEDQARELLRDNAHRLAARGTAADLLTAFLTHPLDAFDAGDPNPMGDGAIWPLPAEVQRWFLDSLHGSDSVPPLALWMAASLCPVGQERCDAQRSLERLARLEPENGAVWLLKAQGARERGETDQARLWVARAAQAPHLDVFERQLGRHLLAGAEGMQLPAMTPEQAEAIGGTLGLAGPASPQMWLQLHLLQRWLAVASSPLGMVRPICMERGEPLGDAVHQQHCRHLFVTIADQSSTVITRRFTLAALAILEPEAMRWREADRQLAWQRAEVSRLLQALDPAGVADYARRVLGTGELATWRELLQREGIGPGAPEGWVPEDATQRQLMDALR